MLRSTLVASDSSIYSASWSSDCQAVAYTQGQSIFIKPLAPNNNPVKVIKTFTLYIQIFSFIEVQSPNLKI